MNLLKRLFGKKQQSPINTVINQPKTATSASTFYYGGSHVAYDHNEDYNMPDPPAPIVYPWPENECQKPTTTRDEPHFGGYNGGDGGGAGASGSWETDSNNSINDYSSGSDSGGSVSSND